MGQSRLAFEQGVGIEQPRNVFAWLQRAQIQYIRLREAEPRSEGAQRFPWAGLGKTFLKDRGDDANTLCRDTPAFDHILAGVFRDSDDD